MQGRTAMNVGAPIIRANFRASFILRPRRVILVFLRRRGLNVTRRVDWPPRDALLFSDYVEKLAKPGDRCAFGLLKLVIILRDRLRHFLKRVCGAMRKGFVAKVLS